MNREILFRGKRLNGDGWVYGDLSYHVHDGEVYVFPGDGYDSPDRYEVDPATVGQWTGLTDLNGKRIFEGDVISCNGSKEVVYFDTSLNIPCFTTGIGRGSSTVPHPYKISKRHVVIGNIHDHPELLEGETQ